jgi:hypothetical protein
MDNAAPSSNKEIYQAIGFTVLLVSSSIPLAFLSMRVLNFVLGKVAV